MADIKNVTVSISLSNAILTGITIGVLFLGGLWAVWTFTLSDLKGDLVYIRGQVGDAQAENRATVKDVHSVETDIRSELSQLTAQLRETTVTLAKLSKSVEGLDGSLRVIDSRMAASVSRQQDFERWVVTRLGAIDVTPTGYPLDWQAADGKIISEIFAGTEPLTQWFNAFSIE